MSTMLSRDELLGRVVVPKREARVVPSKFQPPRTPKLMLSDARVNRIRALVELGIPRKDVMMLEGISKAVLSNILLRYTYRSVDGPSEKDLKAASRFLVRRRMGRGKP